MCDPVASFVLGPVQRLVSGCQQCATGAAGRVEGGNADADGDRVRFSVEHKCGISHGRSDAFDAGQGLFCIDLGQKQGEFLAADASGQVILACRGADQ